MSFSVQTFFSPVACPWIIYYLEFITFAPPPRLQNPSYGPASFIISRFVYVHFTTTAVHFIVVCFEYTTAVHFIVVCFEYILPLRIPNRTRYSNINITGIETSAKKEVLWFYDKMTHIFFEINLFSKLLCFSRKYTFLTNLKMANIRFKYF